MALQVWRKAFLRHVEGSDLKLERRRPVEQESVVTPKELILVLESCFRCVIATIALCLQIVEQLQGLQDARQDGWRRRLGLIVQRPICLSSC